MAVQLMTSLAGAQMTAKSSPCDGCKYMPGCIMWKRGCEAYKAHLNMSHVWRKQPRIPFMTLKECET